MMVRQSRTAAQIEDARKTARRQFGAHQRDDAAAGLAGHIQPPFVKRLAFRTQPVLHVIDGTKAIDRLNQRQIIWNPILVIMTALQVVHRDSDDIVAVAKIIASLEQHIVSSCPVMDKEHDACMFITACRRFANIHRHGPPLLQKLIVLPFKLRDVFFSVCHFGTPIRKGT